MVDYQFDSFENPYPPAGVEDALAAITGGIQSPSYDWAPDAASALGRSSLPIAGSGSTGTAPTLDFRPKDLEYQREVPTSFGLDTSPWGNVLDSLAESFANTNYGRVRGFGANFLKGATEGFATSRGKVMKQREKDREYELEYARKRNEANLQATKDAQERRQKDLDDRLKRSRDRQDYLYQQTVLASLKPDESGAYTLTEAQARALGTGYTAGQKVDRTIMSEALTRTRPKEPKAPEGPKITEYTNINNAYRNDKTVQDFGVIANSVADMRQTYLESATADSPAADIRLIFAYMKTLDPNSVVREGEYATAQNAGGIPEYIRNAYNKAMSGTRLQPWQRLDFLKQAIGKYNSILPQYQKRVGDYRAIAATQPGLDPNIAIPSNELPPESVTIPELPRPEARPRRAGLFERLFGNGAESQATMTDATTMTPQQSNAAFRAAQRRNGRR